VMAIRTELCSAEIGTIRIARRLRLPIAAFRLGVICRIICRMMR
jgi:hypothetical protein